MHFAGIELSNFRSIGDDPVVLIPWKKCNILIGQNNSGKSNVIRAIRRISEFHIGKPPNDWLDLDSHNRDPLNEFRYKLWFRFCENENDWFKPIQQNLDSDDVYFEFCWRRDSAPALESWSAAEVEDFERASRIRHHTIQQQWSRKPERNQMISDLINVGVHAFNHFKGEIPRVRIIPEFRQIKQASDYSLDGSNLIGQLAAFQHPPIGRDEDRDKFEAIQDFTRELLHLPNAELEVTTEEKLVIKNGDLRLPINSFGTGTHEMVILLTAVISSEGGLFCIEEPEIHLHPRLQREFVNFLVHHTDNYYLLSSHSHVLINSMEWVDEVQVFHLKSRLGATSGGPIVSDVHGLRALADLGVRPSDVLMANCIIWVEGPSDRNYVRHWISLIDDEIIEGRDYSIMYYGGKLLSNLSVSREKVPEELIDLLKINQQAIVLMDSDRQKSGGRLNKTKERIEKECLKSGGFAWVTDGREIENLIPPSAFESMLEEYRNVDVKIDYDKYDYVPKKIDRALLAIEKPVLNYPTNKVKYSHLIAKHIRSEDLDPSLRSTLEEVVKKIRRWNN